MPRKRAAASTKSSLPAQKRREEHGYLHGFTKEEQERLYRQARFAQHLVHDRLPYRRAKSIIEVGCGVGAQTEILLRQFPELSVTGVDTSEVNLAQAKRHLASLPFAQGRYQLVQADATALEF